MSRLPPSARTFTLGLALARAPVSARADTIVTRAGDPDMAQAIETARSHLAREFEVGFDSDGRAQGALTLKAAFRIDGVRETIRVAQAARSGPEMTGTPANAPLHFPGLDAGDAVRFSEDMIADRGIVGAAGKLIGHDATRVLRWTMPEDQAGPILDLVSDDPLPAAWRYLAARSRRQFALPRGGGLVKKLNPAPIFPLRPPARLPISRLTQGCGRSSGVEHYLAKVRVVSSNLIARSNGSS